MPDKTRQANVRTYVIRQDKTKQNNTIQDTPTLYKKDNTRQHNAIHDNTVQDKTTQYNSI